MLPGSWERKQAREAGPTEETTGQPVGSVWR
jgi:hypothetical protein